MTLDASATPEQVAYVALQAIRDDFQAKSSKDRDTAIDVQFDIAAANVIAARKPKRSSAEADEYLHDVVYHWTPTVSYYVADFPKTGEEAQKRLVIRLKTETDVELAMEVSDPSGDPKAQVVMLIWLAKDKGMWRVLHFGFDRKRALEEK
jgi:hypothetical protein